jgi:hypothetical protein
MAAHQKDLVVVNALRLAGELATSDATAILEEKLNDQRVAVRFAAVNGLERTMAALAARAPAIPNTRVEQLVGKLGAVVEDPKSTPEVVDAGLRALIAAMGTPARSLAFRTLATATGKVAGRFGPIETPPMIQGVLLRAGQATRDALGNVQLELKGESVKDAGALSGHLLSWASCQIKAGQLAAGNKDARVLPTQVVRIAQTSVALACQKAGVARPDEGVNLGGDFEKATPEGDQAFSRNIVKVIQPLVGQGFGFPDGTFLNCKP